MNKLLHNLTYSAIACLTLWMSTMPATAALSTENETSLQTAPADEVTFQNAPAHGITVPNVPSWTLITHDIVAHSNQGGKKKRSRPILLSELDERSMSRPFPGIDISPGLLLERPPLTMPVRGDVGIKTAPSVIPVEPSFSSSWALSQGTIPAPGALLVLGIAAATSRRRRR